MVIALLFVDPKGFFKNGIAFSHWLITECTNKNVIKIIFINTNI